MKIIISTLLLVLLPFFSSFYTREKYILPNARMTEDSAFVSIPFTLKLGAVSDDYILEKILQIDSFYTKNIKSPYYSGGFLVAKNGQILYEDYQGFANISTKRKITSSTPIHLASVSKILTCTAILRLVQQENIELDQKVTDWLPNFPYKQTTIRTLLNHRSGLPHYDKLVFSKKGILSNEDVLNALIKNKVKQVFSNNSRFDYCNTNYVILALIIEKATGQNYLNAMKDLVFNPIGMKNTFVFNYETDKDTVSRSYNGNKLWGWDHFDALYGDKNIYSTPRDLVKFDLATYSPDFIQPEILQEAYKGYSPNKQKMKDYGLGMRMKLWPKGEKQLYHNGWWHGNNTSFVPVKKDTVTIICLGNKYSNRPYATLNLAPIF